MKPYEVCNCEISKYDMRSKDRIVEKKWDEDCIIAYDKAKLGSIFIIKIKGGYAGFYYINNKLGGYENYGYVIKRIALKDAVAILEDNIIVNQEEYSKVKKQLIFEKLQDE